VIPILVVNWRLNDRWSWSIRCPQVRPVRRTRTQLSLRQRLGSRFGRRLPQPAVPSERKWSYPGRRGRGTGCAGLPPPVRRLLDQASFFLYAGAIVGVNCASKIPAATRCVRSPSIPRPCSVRRSGCGSNGSASMTHPERLAGNNIILLVCLLALILFYPLFRRTIRWSATCCSPGSFFSGIYSLEFSARSRMVLLPLASLTAATRGSIITSRPTGCPDRFRHFLGHAGGHRGADDPPHRAQPVVTPTIILSSSTVRASGRARRDLVQHRERHPQVLPWRGSAASCFRQRHAGLQRLPVFVVHYLTTVGYGDVMTVSHLTGRWRS